MIHNIWAKKIISLRDFKKNPMAVAKETRSGSVAVLSRNKPFFYCLSQDEMEAFNELLKAKDEELSLQK